jgi:hypothetical protein
MFAATITNDGLRIGTVYPIFLLAGPYNRSTILFSSDRDLDETERRALRTVDVSRRHSMRCILRWQVPESLPPSQYYLKCQVWNPLRLYERSDRDARRGMYLFDESDWVPALEVVPPMAEMTRRQPRVFLSYATSSEEHRNWVVDLRNQLIRHGIDAILAETDLHASMEITLFMEQELKKADAIILICSNPYVEKANERKGGVGYETVITSKQYLASEPEHRRWIPVLRNNTLSGYNRIPDYLGSTKWIDMDRRDWAEGPLSELVHSIELISGRTYS